jgi:GT2 family glycosyltransferase
MNDQELMPLHIVILNWNLPHDTIACIESIQDNPLADLKIVVVDNGSSDNSVALLRGRFGNGIKVIENPENFGFAAGMNTGISYALSAGARSILLLNNDTIVDSTMISKMLTAAYDLPRAGILAPAIYYYQAPTRIWRCGDKETSWLPMPLKVTERDVGRYLSAPFKIDYATGCGILVKQAVFEAIGMFDTSYFMYFEDADFCRRARRANHEIWCVPEAKMWHKVSLSAQKDKPANRYARSWGQVWFYRTHPHGPFAGLTQAYLFFKLMWTTVTDLLRGDWALIKPLWLGTWNGYRDHLTTPPRFK